MELLCRKGYKINGYESRGRATFRIRVATEQSGVLIGGRLRSGFTGRFLAAEQERELVEGIVRPLGGLVAGIFTGIRPHVPVEVAREATEEARRVEADCLLSFGGGSTTGATKAVALETELPIVAVPTTYAGSEMTPVSGLTEEGRKTTGKSMNVLPRVVIYDPELTYSLPDFVTGPSALNAVAHCVEAFYAPSASPISSLMAEDGTRLRDYWLK